MPNSRHKLKKLCQEGNVRALREFARSTLELNTSNDSLRDFIQKVQDKVSPIPDTLYLENELNVPKWKLLEIAWSLIHEHEPGPELQQSNGPVPLPQLLVYNNEGTVAHLRALISANTLSNINGPHPGKLDSQAFPNSADDPSRRPPSQHRQAQESLNPRTAGVAMLLVKKQACYDLNFQRRDPSQRSDHLYEFNNPIAGYGNLLNRQDEEYVWQWSPELVNQGASNTYIHMIVDHTGLPVISALSHALIRALMIRYRTHHFASEAQRRGDMSSDVVENPVRECNRARRLLVEDIMARTDPQLPDNRKVQDRWEITYHAANIFHI